MRDREFRHGVRRAVRLLPPGDRGPEAPMSTPSRSGWRGLLGRQARDSKRVRSRVGAALWLLATIVVVNWGSAAGSSSEPRRPAAATAPRAWHRTPRPHNPRFFRAACHGLSRSETHRQKRDARPRWHELWDHSRRRAAAACCLSRRRARSSAATCGGRRRSGPSRRAVHRASSRDLRRRSRDGSCRPSHWWRASLPLIASGTGVVPCSDR